MSTKHAAASIIQPNPDITLTSEQQKEIDNNLRLKLTTFLNKDNAYLDFQRGVFPLCMEIPVIPMVDSGDDDGKMVPIVDVSKLPVRWGKSAHGNLCIEFTGFPLVGGDLNLI